MDEDANPAIVVPGTSGRMRNTTKVVQVAIQLRPRPPPLGAHMALTLTHTRPSEATQGV